MINTACKLVLAVTAALLVVLGIPARPAGAQGGITIEGAANGTYAVTVHGPDLAVPLRIVSGAEKETKVRVDVSSLRAPGNAEVAPVNVKREGGQDLLPTEELTVPALGSVTVILTSKVNETGIHNGSIALIYNAARHSTELAVTRERPLPSIAVDRVGASSTNQARVTVRETAGRQVVLDRPTLVPLLEVIATDDSEAVDYDSVNVEQAKHEGGRSTWQSVGETFTIGPHATAELLITIEGLPSQGKYEGTLRMANAGDKGAVESTLTFLRRVSAWWALLLLGLGFALAEGVRWAGTRSVRLNAKASVVARRDQLRTVRTGLAPAATETGLIELLDSLDDAVTELFVRVDAGTSSGTQLEAALTALDARIAVVPKWARIARAAANSTDPTVAQAELDTAAAYIRGEGGTAEAAQTALEQARTKVASTPKPAGVSVTVGRAEEPDDNIPSTPDLKRQLFWLRAIPLVIGSVAAVLIGLLLLYSSNRTWGNTTDKLTMFLWAFGVYQVANVAAASSAQALVTKIQGGGNAQE